MKKAKERVPHDLFYWDKHQRQDARLHDEILNEGDHDRARAVSVALMRRLGLSESRITALLGSSDGS